jgi:hypothetical protein
MNVSANIEDLAKQLQELEKQVEKKLEGMVRGFALSIAESAVDNTPIGDSVKYAGYYQSRTDLPQVEGLSKGNWSYAEGEPVLRRIAGQDAGNAALDGIETNLLQYKLGETFAIGNAVPYIGELENGYSLQAPAGIMNPTMQHISGTYATDLVRLYDMASGY